MLEQLHDLHRHMAWADTRVLESLRRSSGEPPQALRIYAHVLGAEHVWLARLRQDEATVPVWPKVDVDSCARLAEASAREVGRFVSDLKEGDLEREIPYTNSTGQTFRSKIQDILLHLFLHGAYHRGQVALLIRGQGGEPEATDYIAFVRGTPAAKSGPPPGDPRGDYPSMPADL